MLKWLCFSLRPLYLEELAEIFILDPEKDVPFDLDDRLFSPEAVLTYLPNLVVTSSDDIERSKGPMVKFAHFSIQEYILSQRITQRPTKDFHVEEADAHLHIAKSCLTYHLHLSRDILLTRDTFQKFMLWSYVSYYWHSHIEKVAIELLPVALESLVLQLLDRRSRAYLNMNRISNDMNRNLNDMNQILNADRLLNSDWDLHPEEVCPPLFYCASLPTLWPIRYLIENGANIDEVSDNGPRYESSFALQHAIMKRKTENAKFLLHRNANTNIQGGMFGNALQAAARMENHEIVQLLLDKGADVNAQGGVLGNALQAAAVHRNAETVKLILDKGAEVNMQGGMFGNALQAAASVSDAKMVQLLLDKGANVNAHGGVHGNALQAAAARIKAEIVQLLLDNGADVNAPGGEYGTALQAAAMIGGHETAQLLLDKGADINAHGGFYGNALQAAANSGSLKTFQLLLDNGADVNARGGEYGTALQGAATLNNADVVLLLLDKGVDINAQGGRFGNAVQAAVARQRYDIAQLLHSRGAKVDPPGPEWEEMLSRVSKANRGEDMVNRLKEFQADPTGFLA